MTETFLLPPLQSMSARYAGIFYSHRLVVVSSDNDILNYDNLTPLDPPEYDEDDEPMLDPPEDDEDHQPMLVDTLDLDRNPFLTSDDIPFNHTIFPSSDDVPLASVLHGQDYFLRCL